jgi:hypothetical protein
MKHKKKGVILNIDYEKAYDMVSWQFLEEMLQSRGFSPIWVDWVMSLVMGGYICIRVNDENNPYFKPSKGLRQGDPLSPLLFNLVVDVFTRMMVKAANMGYISEFMDDMILGASLAYNMLMIPCCF